jgi:hypothetical protein
LTGSGITTPGCFLNPNWAHQCAEERWSPIPSGTLKNDVTFKIESKKPTKHDPSLSKCFNGFVIRVCFFSYQLVLRTIVIIFQYLYFQSICIIFFNLSSNTTKIFGFIDIIFFQYLYSQFICIIFIDGHTNENTLLVKLSLVISGLSVSSSMIKLPMDLLMTKANTPKFIRFIPSVFPSGNLKDRTQFC